MVEDSGFSERRPPDSAPGNHQAIGSGFDRFLSKGEGQEHVQAFHAQFVDFLDRSSGVLQRKW